MKNGISGLELRELAQREMARPGGLARRYAELVTRAARAGNTAARVDVAVMQMEGYRDGQGRVVVRANPKAAARAFGRAAALGDKHAAFSLGYCLDVGLGLRRNSGLAMKWYRRAWRGGDPGAAANIATMYRDRLRLDQAAAWWRRAVEAGWPDEAVELGYCYQYGIGVRRDLAEAVRCFRLAIRSRKISEAGCEEAMYHLAVLKLDRVPARRAEAVALLERASKDKDYPEAMKLLDQVRGGRAPVPCRCRRDILKSLPGHARCEVHRRGRRDG